jgi:hypothetical protein
MKRREFITLLGGAVVAWPLVVEAQHAEALRRIGFLSISPQNQVLHLLASLEEGLRELNYIQPRDFAFVTRFADGKVESLPKLAAEHISLKVDLIVAFGATAARAAKNATTTIPIVMLREVRRRVPIVRRSSSIDIVWWEAQSPRLVARQLVGEEAPHPSIEGLRAKLGLDEARHLAGSSRR